jgi:hypothetical protein
MPTLDNHEDRIQRLEAVLLTHEARMQSLEDMMARVIALNELVVQLLQRQEGDTHNGQ